MCTSECGHLSATCCAHVSPEAKAMERKRLAKVVELPILGTGQQ